MAVPLGSPLGGPAPSLYEQSSRPVLHLADAIDPDTQDCRDIHAGGDVVDEMVHMAVAAVRGSSPGLQNTGQRFGDVRKLGASAKAEIDAEARVAMKPLVDRGLIRLLAVVVLIGADWFEVTIRYKNLRRPGSTLVDEVTVRKPIGSD